MCRKCSCMIDHFSKSGQIYLVHSAHLTWLVTITIKLKITSCFFLFTNMVYPCNLHLFFPWISYEASHNVHMAPVFFFVLNILLWQTLYIYIYIIKLSFDISDYHLTIITDI